jgi:DNA polymerase-3 subunit beta
MKIQADCKTLADALGWVTSCVSRKPEHPILAGVRLTTKADLLIISAQSGEVGQTAQMKVTVADPGEALVSARFLGMIISTLRGKEVSLEIKDSSLIIKSGRSTYKTRLLKIGDFPEMPKVAKTVGSLEAEELQKLIHIAVGPIDDAAAIQATMGLHLESNNGELIAVGLDKGGRSVHIGRAAWKEKAPIDATIASAALAAAARGMSGEIKIGARAGTLSLADADRSVTIRQYATAFAQWKKLLEKEPKDFVELAAVDLIDAMSRAIVLSEARHVIIEITPSELVVQLGSDIGEGTDVIDAEGQIEARFGIDPGLLAQALGALDAERIRLGFLETGEIKQQISMTPVAGDAVTCIIMPRRIGAAS